MGSLAKETNDIEAHIDTVGEPSMYPQLVELVEGLSKNRHVKTVSMQTNGHCCQLNSLTNWNLLVFLG